jgi:hypothetical protein
MFKFLKLSTSSAWPCSWEAFSGTSQRTGFLAPPIVRPRCCSPQAIDLASMYVTLPGLAIAILSGMSMAGLGYPKRRWLFLHMAAAGAIALIAVTVMIPVERDLLALASAAAEKRAPLETFAGSSTREALFGAGNIVLALAAIALGVVKPLLRKQQSQGNIHG